MVAGEDGQRAATIVCFVRGEFADPSCKIFPSGHFGLFLSGDEGTLAASVYLDHHFSFMILQ
jgi:hypothetical protein